MRISDWSSDVCSSDLSLAMTEVGVGSIRQRQDMMRLLEVRRVDHLAGDLEHADAGVGGERIDDRLRARDLFGRRREGRIDRADLRGVDRHHAGKAVAPRAGGKIGRASCRERVWQYG